MKETTEKKENNSNSVKNGKDLNIIDTSLLEEEIMKKKVGIEKKEAVLDKSFSKIASFRLLVFLAAVIFIFAGNSEKNILLLSLGLASFVIFIFLVKKHADTQEKLLGLKAETKVLNKYLMRFSGQWRGFSDSGEEFLKANSNLSRDLDLVGKNSLYQMLSIAHTNDGRKKLADTLSLISDHRNDIDRRYDAIQELSEKKDFLIEFEASSERILARREKELEKRLVTDEDAESNKEKEQKSNEDDKVVSHFPVWMYPLMVLVPVMNIACIIYILSVGKNPAYILATFIIGLIITWGPKMILDRIISPVYLYGSAANDYYKMLSLVAEENFESDLLKEIHEKTTSRDGLLQAIKALGRIGAFNNISFNTLAHMILAGFLGWDYYIALAAARWSKKNEGVFEDCIGIVSDIEELGSLAVLSIVRNTCRAVVTDGYSLNMKNVYHPLIDPETVIANDADISGRLTIITGSNMSGKTTFMRTVAINMVLSYIGAGVCADKFSVPYMKIFTSMRVMDDVAGGISTFYAEILRIKAMAEYVAGKSSVPAICLIDEIFKGTNSADRIVGAEEALKKLSEGNAMVIVTTHDFELCDLKKQNGEPADNYHFEEHYENGELKFDYKIRDGRCKTRNAMAILKMAGLME